MKEEKKLQAMPSEVEEDGNKSVLKTMPDKEKDRFYQKIKKNLEAQAGYYFMQHPEEWIRLTEE